MKNFILRPAPFILLLLILAGMLSGCFLDGKKVSDAVQKTVGDAAGAGATEAWRDDPSAQAVLAFSGDFKTIEKTSVDKDIDFYLWEAAMSEGDSAVDVAAQSSSASLTQLAEKFKQEVASTGVHYVEHSNSMGMDYDTEYWIRDGKFRMLEKALNQMKIFDGEYCYTVNLDEKTAGRVDKDYPNVSADVSLKVNGTLSGMLYSGYNQEPDQKVGDFDCSVYYLDIEAMGAKGNRMYVDKATGMLVKSVYGDEENGMVTEVTEFQQGGFTDEVFTVPAGIAIED